jgi:hypothetical protein
MVNPVSILGQEFEGGLANISVDTSVTIPVYLVGPHSAMQGDLLPCRFVDYRWAAERSSPPSPPAPGHTLLGCPCTNIPSTIYFHVASQPQNVESLVFPATLQYGPVPSELTQYNSDPVGYYSTTALWASDSYYKFRYWFGCSQGTYFVFGLMTPDSPLGYPGKFGIMSWLVGMPGNSCSPFSLTNGASSSPLYMSQGIKVDAVGPA